MRKLISSLLILALMLALLPAQAAKIIPVMTWDELLKRAEAGETPLYLGANLQGDQEHPLKVTENITIIGSGFSLTDVTLSSGQVIFSDVAIFGENGMKDENGGAALTIEGKGTVAVLSASASASGGRSGSDGLEGGHAIVVGGENCGVILRGSTSASGGTGRFSGGCGIYAASCTASILVTDTAAVVGGTASNEGAHGIFAPACVKVQISSASSIAGGDGYLYGGHGVMITACETCSALSPAQLSDTAVVVGGMGITAGDGLHLQGARMIFTGTPMLFGGAGSASGLALSASDSELEMNMDTLMAFGGGYSDTQSPVLSYGLCRISGNPALILETPGSLLSAMPAEQVPERVENILRQKTGRETNEEVTLSITALPLTGKVSGTSLSVEKGKADQAQVSGTSLKIRVYNITNEKYFSFNQRFYQDGENIYYILIADQSQQGYTVNASAAALKKLSSLGITHLVYTSAAPIYCERIIDLQTILSDMEGMDYEIDKVLFGTADDCVIYVQKDGAQEYRVELMGQAICPVPEMEESEPNAEETQAE